MTAHSAVATTHELPWSIVPEHSTENHTVTQAVPYLQLQTSIYGGRWKDVPIVEPEDEEAS